MSIKNFEVGDRVIATNKFDFGRIGTIAHIYSSSNDICQIDFDSKNPSEMNGIHHSSKHLLLIDEDREPEVADRIIMTSDSLLGEIGIIKSIEPDALEPYVISLETGLFPVYSWAGNFKILKREKEKESIEHPAWNKWLL